MSVMRLLGQYGRLISIDLTRRTIAIERLAHSEDAKWSAGVVFSGAKKELPLLRRCLDGLLAQRQLQSESCGEILVCGPAEARYCTEDYPTVRYIQDPTDHSRQFRIAAKKNFLASHFRNDKFIILHARVILESGCLDRIPRHFDITSVNQETSQSGAREPYLSLVAVDPNYLLGLPRFSPKTVRQTAIENYLDLYRVGLPYLDGGCIVTTREVWERCSLNGSLSWGEAEDMDWCHRAILSGFLVDMCIDARATSATHKLSESRLAGSFPSWQLRNMRRIVVDYWARSRYAISKLRGHSQ